MSGEIVARPTRSRQDLAGPLSTLAMKRAYPDVKNLDLLCGSDDEDGDESRLERDLYRPAAKRPRCVPAPVFTRLGGGPLFLIAYRAWIDKDARRVRRIDYADLAELYDVMDAPLLVYAFDAIGCDRATETKAWLETHVRYGIPSMSFRQALEWLCSPSWPEIPAAVPDWLRAETAARGTWLAFEMPSGAGVHGISAHIDNYYPITHDYRVEQYDLALPVIEATVTITVTKDRQNSSIAGADWLPTQLYASAPVPSGQVSIDG